MLKDTAKRYCKELGCNCAESTLLAVSDEYGLGLGPEDAKLMGGFGGGLGSGLTCGALCGAVAALGKMHLETVAHAAPEFRGLCAEYVAAFREAMGGTECSVIKPLYFVPGKGCIAAIQKAADTFEAFADAHGYPKESEEEAGK